MDTFILLFKPYRAWLDRCLGMLIFGVLLTQQGWGQLYAVGGSTGNFKYFDVTTHTWTTKANSPVQLTGLTAYQGKIYGSAYATTNFYVYDPVANTWTQKAAIMPTGFTNSRLVTAGAYIYAVSFDLGKFSRYNPATNTWAQLSATGLPQYPTYMAYDGGDYIYCGIQGTLALARYSISGDSWTLMSTPPDYLNGGVTFTNGKLYFLNGNNTKFYSFDPITSVYTQLPNASTAAGSLVAGMSNYMYRTGTDFQQYDISTNTWTAYTGPGFSFPTLAYLEECSLQASIVASSATCATTGGANANASLTLTSHSGGATKVGYSAGSSYTGPDFATATAVTTAPMVLSNSLANPTVTQPYTIRLFQDATCYKDVVATLAPMLCLTSDLSLSLSPAVQSGSKGELLTYTFTLTNAGPDAASDVQVDIKVPTNATLLTASPQLGTYSEATHKWDISSLPVGAKILTITLKMN